MNKTNAPHLSGYQARDFEVIDYQMTKLAGTSLMFRGPIDTMLKNGDYFVCVGAAQTFGCFCDNPYPQLLSSKLELPYLNLGYGGAGPEFFAKQESLDPILNNAKFIVVQTMSGRSQSNSLYDCDGLELLTRRSDGQQISSLRAYQDLVDGSEFVRAFPPKRLTAAIARRLGIPRSRTVVSETRQLWIENHENWLKRIEVPKVLLWFSQRQPEYEEGYLSVSQLFAAFPQLINQQCIEAIKPEFDEYVECVTSRGFPHKLISRFTGKPTTVDPSNDRADLGGETWTHDNYYPSPEMHEDAAQALETAIRNRGLFE